MTVFCQYSATLRPIITEKHLSKYFIRIHLIMPKPFPFKQFSLIRVNKYNALGGIQFVLDALKPSKPNAIAISMSSVYDM